ncbi:MAG: hypothetical protein HRT90_08760 [Candidatus Margulisbacteria bacterium]|nr:hypothetical protein [Candidatus Margulisiibacteriota bacterium]
MGDIETRPASIKQLEEPEKPQALAALMEEQQELVTLMAAEYKLVKLIQEEQQELQKMGTDKKPKWLIAGKSEAIKLLQKELASTKNMVGEQRALTKLMVTKSNLTAQLEKMRTLEKDYQQDYGKTGLMRIAALADRKAVAFKRKRGEYYIYYYDNEGDHTSKKLDKSKSYELELIELLCNCHKVSPRCFGKEGKMYLGSIFHIAINNFFRENGLGIVGQMTEKALVGLPLALEYGSDIADPTFPYSPEVSNDEYDNAVATVPTLLNTRVHNGYCVSPKSKFASGKAPTVATTHKKPQVA